LGLLFYFFFEIVKRNSFLIDLYLLKVSSLVMLMRIIEILVIIFLILLSIQFVLPSTIGKQKKGTVMGVLSLVGIITFLTHIFLEGLRWQMLPVYIPTILLFLWGVIKLLEIYRIQTGAVPEPKRGPPRVRRGVVIIVVAVILVSSSLFLDSLLPAFYLPIPSGEYAIGTTTFELTDDTRNETFTEPPNDHRRILIRAWYPSDTVTGHRMAPYVDAPGQFGIGIEQSFGFPAFMVSHFQLTKTQSYLNAPLSQAETSFPVLIFSHGYGGLIMQDTVLMEELASNGYIVFSISHSYEAAVTSFPDGSVIYEATEEMYANLGNSLHIWANDTVYLVDQLEIPDNPNIPNVLWDGMDLNTIDVFGHSFGGTTAEHVILEDSRFDVGISLDSPHGGSSLIMNMTKPFMLLFGPDYGNPELNDTIFLRSEGTCYGLFINGTRHYNFGDISIWSPLLRSFGLLGSIDGYRMLDILNSYVLAFFNEHLIGIASPLLDGPSLVYPEVLFYSK
jgi:predicted dienelactone hydrolase